LTIELIEQESKQGLTAITHIVLSHTVLLLYLLGCKSNSKMLQTSDRGNLVES